MSLSELIMPKLGESIMEATILKWHKQPGDTVEMDEKVLDIATDKVDSEVPSTAAGTIKELFFKENDVVPIGAVLATIEGGNGSTVVAPTSHEVAPKAEVKEETVIEEKQVPFQPAETPAKMQPSTGARFYSPLVMNIAQSEGIGFEELEKIPGTGQDGRVSKKDILNYVQKKGTQQAPVIKVREQNLPAEEKRKEAQPLLQIPTIKAEGNVEIIEMDRMRKLIAKHMVHSKQTSAHVTSFVECDVTNLVQWRNKVKSSFEKREGEKITFTPLFVEAVAKALKKYPLINSSVEGDNIIVKKDINIGMATALPSGNLIVPVIKNADQYNLTGLTKQVNNLANTARNGRLKPDDTLGGTFTLTNVGTTGSIMGTPIINQPQVAILAVGAIKKRPMVIETPQGDTIGIRHMMYMSMSYDHRIIDGALGSTFLNEVNKELENFDTDRSI